MGKDAQRIEVVIKDERARGGCCGCLITLATVVASLGGVLLYGLL